jgi:tRNA(Phe) wybutosine-synthesizing methylase Tyw3
MKQHIYGKLCTGACEETHKEFHVEQESAEAYAKYLIGENARMTEKINRLEDRIEKNNEEFMKLIGR